MFPIVIIVILALGSALIAYARQTIEDRTAADITNATYYLSFGVYVCDEWIALPDAPVVTDLAEVRDGATLVAGKPGVVEWLPQVLSGQRRARLSAVLDLYSIEVSNDRISFPPSINGGETLVEDSAACGQQGATVFVNSWDLEGLDSSKKTSIANLDSVRLTNDGFSVALVFAPDGTEIDPPPAADEVALLRSADQ